MKEFYREFIKDEYNRFKLVEETELIEERTVIHTAVYEDNDALETIMIREIVKEKMRRPQVPVIILNFENELGLSGYEDNLINSMIEQGARVVFVKCSYYERQVNQDGFITQGIHYWKRNMVALQFCYEDLVKKGYTSDISFVAMNGLSNCSLALINGNDISCNRIFMINGCMDFQYVYENNLWNEIFHHGYYHYAKNSKNNPFQDNPELTYLNPYDLFMQAEAEKKFYFDNNSFLMNDRFQPIPYTSMDEILKRIKEEI